ncbi:MAG: TetR/AcrR family transcriptional regulator [Acidimicrobiales bacterium]|nr:TetR/AcrR family transcriptional regulator [Acidimicrobiales bacterium]
MPKARRSSEPETERRLLDAATNALSRTGLTVSLDHLSLEELIQDAGVSRSAVYRRWPSKDQFLRDLMTDLARNAPPSIVDEEIQAIENLIADRAEQLRTPEGRDALMAEAIRQLGLMDFEIFSHSPRWRTYLALNAAYVSISDDDARAQVRTALAQAENAHRRAVAKALELLTGLLGYRVRPETAASFDTVATLLSAAMRGLLTMATSDPALGAQRLWAAPFWPTERVDWSLPALAVGAVITALLEPDPDIEWEPHRAMALLEAVGTSQDPPAR